MDITLLADLHRDRRRGGWLAGVIMKGGGFGLLGTSPWHHRRVVGGFLFRLLAIRRRRSDPARS